MDSDYIFTQFEELYKIKNLHDCDNVLIKDGIINPVLFNKQHTKILFIAKEHNYLGTINQIDYEADYRAWWNLHVRYTFSHRISEWAYGILNNFDTTYEQITYEQKFDSLRSISFINVKKSSGKSVSKSKIICDYIIQSRQLLRQQIKEISPTIIICCFRDDYYIEHLFGTKLIKAVSNKFSHGKWNNTDVINFYHPSSRKNKYQLYELMNEAIGKIKFG